MFSFMKRVALLVAAHLIVPLAAAQGFRIIHIDAEQGDATLMISPSGRTLLVDSGKNGHGDRIKSAMDNAGVSAIDDFVLTHYHEDHMGGIDDLIADSVHVLHAYDRGDKEFLPASTTTSSTFRDYQKALGEHATHLTRGETIPFDPEVLVTCISSGGVVLGETSPTHGVDENDMSISLLVEFHGFRYFIGGDCEKPTEQKIADHNLVLDIDACEADHHGSNTSSSPDFMNDLSPTVIIISNGNNALYQHPRQSVLDFYSTMTPPPTVFQTNKYFQGGAGGNEANAFIADTVSTGTNGTIVLTVAQDGGPYTVSYRDRHIQFATKHPEIPNRLVIESLLPDPVGDDIDLEEVTIHNAGGGSVGMSGWFLRDRSGRVWSLAGLGSIAAGQSATIRRNHMPMNLNNNGDGVFLIAPDNSIADSVSYTSTQEGVRISTGH
jgi:beta-lactamase superfamily II metal-dependent hydrolase